MTHEQALQRLDEIGDYLRNVRDTGYPLSHEDIKHTLSVLEDLENGLERGLSQRNED